MQFMTNIFKGQVPILVPHLLKNEFSTYTVDCELRRMSLRPSNKPLATGITFDQEPKKIYPHYTVPLESSPGIDTGVFDGWFWFEYDTTAFFSVLPNDKWDRIYFLDENNQPRITDADNITITPHTTGGPYTPSVDNSWKLGVPPPATALSGTDNGDGTSSIIEDRAYLYTFVDRWGAEGPPSPVSAIVTGVKNDGSVAISGMAAFPVDYNFAGGKRRIYRAVSGTTRTDYLYIGETTGTTFTDNIPPEKLGEVIPTRTWYPPPDFIDDWVMAPNGALVGFANNTVFFSMPYLPTAWPPDYQIAINHDIVGMAPVSQGVAVMTNNNPYFISGVIPQAAQVRKLDLEEACINAKSIASLGNKAYYASPNGIAAVAQGEAKVMSYDLITRGQWEKLNPVSAEGVNYADDYLLFYDATGLPDSDVAHVYDRGDPMAPVKGALSLESDQYFQFWSDFTSAAVMRPHDEKFFGATLDSEVGAWALYEINPEDTTGDLSRELTWRSKVLLSERPVNFACAQLEAEAYPVMFTMWADDKRVYQQSINNDDVFRLPGGFKAREWQFEVRGETEVKKITFAESVQEMAEA